MANAIETRYDAKTAITISLGGLVTNTSQQSTMIDNSSTQYPGALIYCQIKSGSSGLPTAGTVYEIFLLRGDDHASSTHRTDGAGASDAAISILNAPLLGVIVVTAAASTIFYGEFDTSFAGVLGKSWGIAVRNSSGQTLNASGHQIEYVGYLPEIQ